MNKLNSIKVLIEKGADVQKRDNINQLTPLGSAIISNNSFGTNNVDAIKLLIENGATMDEDFGGPAPIQVTKNADVMKLLLSLIHI